MTAGLAIRRYRARLPVRAEPVSARLALQALAADLEDALPRSLPPQALLWLRRVSVQLPAVALRRLAAGRDLGVAQGREQIDAALARAVRPALGPVPPDAEAVLFADEAEMLACLALAAQAGELDRWWWRGLLGARWPGWQAAWDARPWARVAAARLLVRAGPAPLGAALAGQGAGAAPAPHRSDAAVMQPPEAAVVPDAARGGAPARPRQAARAGSGADAGPARAAMDDAPVEAGRALPAPRPGAAARPAADQPLLGDTAAAAAGSVARGSARGVPSPHRRRESKRATAVEGAAAVMPAPAASEAREPPAQAANAEPAPPSGAALRTRGVAPARPLPDADESDVMPPAQPRGAAPIGQTPSGVAAAAGDPVRPGRVEPAHRAPPGPASDPTGAAEDTLVAWPWPQACLSHQGPLLFLVNALLDDGLYPDFTQPRDPGLPVPLWALLGALAQAWRLPPDPLQARLAEQAGGWQPDLLCADLPAVPGVAAGPWAAWLPAYARCLRGRLCRRLGLPPRRWTAALHRPVPGRLWVSAGAWELALDLADHDVAWRLAGLDRDPGWLPSVDISLRFRFT